MAELFIDTSAWYPLLVSSHPDHAAVADALREHVAAGTRVVTSNHVIAETHALLMRRVGIRAGLAFVQRVRQPPNLVIDSTAALEARAVADWLERFDDQPFSLVDAVSFEIMAKRGITMALTLDHHFQTAGFGSSPARRT
jgi:predicted nucleic acid-binding protein